MWQIRDSQWSYTKGGKGLLFEDVFDAPLLLLSEETQAVMTTFQPDISVPQSSIKVDNTWVVS
jgi:hypothetical protein